MEEIFPIFNFSTGNSISFKPSGVLSWPKFVPYPNLVSLQRTLLSHTIFSCENYKCLLWILSPPMPETFRRSWTAWAPFLIKHLRRGLKWKQIWQFFLHVPNKELHSWKLDQPYSLHGSSYNVILSYVEYCIVSCHPTEAATRGAL